MNTETNENKSNTGKFLGLAGIAILAIAVIYGIWGFFGQSKSNADSHMSNQNHTEMTKNSPMNDKSKMDSKKQEMSETSPNTKSDVPVALVDAGEFGENIYDMAKIDDWKIAEAKLNDLKASVKKLDSEKIGSAKLDETLAKLEKSVAVKDKNATLELSNLFTLDAANLTAKYDPKIPVEVTKLDYYGREIEIWAAEKNEAKLKATTLEIRKTWDAVKSKIEANNGTKEATVFEDLVKKTEAAKSIDDYAKLATQILDEVDNLENVFK